MNKNKAGQRGKEKGECLAILQNLEAGNDSGCHDPITLSTTTLMS